MHTCSPSLYMYVIAANVHVHVYVHIYVHGGILRVATLFKTEQYHIN